MFEITKPKKKILTCIGRKCSIFRNKTLKGKNKMFGILILMPRCPYRDFQIAENKLYLCFLHKKPACKKMSTRKNLILTKLILSWKEFFIM